MNKLLIVQLFLFITVTYAIKAVDNDKCTPPCSKYGECFESTNATTKEYKCECRALYYGSDCSSRWSDEKRWSMTFLFYSISEIIMMILCVAFCVYQTYVTLRYATFAGWKKWSVATLTLFLLGSGCLIRAIEFALDPHAVRQILPIIAEELMFNIPLILWISAGLSLQLYWVELHLRSGIREVMFVKKLRPTLIVLVIACALTVLPAAISNAVVANPVSQYFYNGALIIFLAIFVGISTIFGTRLRRTIKRIYASTNVKGFKAFLLRITVSLYAMAGFAIATVLTLLLFVILSAKNERWLYVGLHFILRLEEFGMIYCCLFILIKKVPNRGTPNASGGTTSFGSKSVELDAESTKSETDLP